MDKIYSSKWANLIVKDRYILIIDNKNNRRICTVNSTKPKLGKREINVKFFENKPINTFWQVDSSPYEEISHEDFFDDNILEDEDGEKIDNETDRVSKNNKEIYSLGSQKLTDVEIKKLQERGIKGDELIKIIVDNNTSMDKRTIFSQEKILKRKKIKHLHKIWIAETNIFNIMETLFMFNDRSINFMRMDTVSTMLVYSSFIGKTKTLIYEDIDNVLTSIYASRSSKESTIVSLFNNKIHNKNLSIFNLPRCSKYIVTHTELDNVVNPKNIFYKMFINKYLLGFDNLVLCIKNMADVLLLTMKLYPYLKNSGSIVVYSREIQYLVELERLLFDSKFAFDVRIHETYLREYQVLSQRTHPMMNNKGFSGYVLTAIKLNNNLEA